MGYPLSTVDHSAIFQHFGPEKPEQAIRKIINDNLERGIEKMSAYYWARRGVIPPHVLIDLFYLDKLGKICLPYEKIVKDGEYSQK